MESKEQYINSFLAPIKQYKISLKILLHQALLSRYSDLT
jgi:hypothetical protein